MKIYERYDNDLKEQLDLLNNGDMLIIPTDTVYGLAIKMDKFINFDKNIKKIYSLKKRDINKKIILLVSDIENIYRLVDNRNIDKRLINILNKFMPGDLSVILRANDTLKNMINYDTIGVRIPNNKLARDIISHLGGALFVTSANVSGGVSSHKLDEIDDEILNNVSLIVKQDNECLNSESTILDYTNQSINILRKGRINKKMLEEIDENIT